MSEKVIVALDAMGGDNAPVEIVKGAVEAVKEEAGLLVKLVGREEQVRAELAKYTYPQGQIEVVDAPDVIETGEQPVMAIRRKKDSSMVRALTMVKEKKADAFVSAGSSGAILVGGQVIVGRIRGVERPPMAPLIPTAKGVFYFSRQRRKCRFQTVLFSPVGKDGIYLYGKYHGYKKSEGCHC